MSATIAALDSVTDIRAIADGVARDLIGRKLDDEELARQVRRFQSRQKSEQSAAIDVGMVEEGGGTLTSPASAQAAIEEAIEQDLPVEAAAHSTADAFAQMLQLMGAG